MADRHTQTCHGQWGKCPNVFKTLSEGKVKREVPRCRLTLKHPDYCKEQVDG